MSTIELDLTAWPVVVVTPPAGLVTDAELDSFMADYRRRVTGRRELYSVVIDLRVSSGLTPTQRKRLSREMEEGEQRGYANCGGALIFSSTLMRGMLTAILWLKKPKHEMRICSTREEAVTWAREQVAIHARGPGMIAIIRWSTTRAAHTPAYIA